MTGSTASVTIDCAARELPDGHTGALVIVIDVLRATTTAMSAVAAGRRVFPAASMEHAVRLAADLDRPILAGELGGLQPYGFDLQNSPSRMHAGTPEGRPIILLSTSGTGLMVSAARRGPAQFASLRNVGAQAAHALATGRDVLILGADSRGEFRDEDQLCAARIAVKLVAGGHRVVDARTSDVIDRWADAPDDAFLDGRSATYLRDTGQHEDLEFVTSHVDDLSSVYELQDGEVHAVAVTSPGRGTQPTTT